MATKELEQIVTGEFRVNFAKLLTPKPDQKGADKYSVMMMFPKTATADLIAIKKLCYKVAIERYGAKADGTPNVPAGFKWPWKDGDTNLMNDGTLRKNKYPEIVGHYIMEAGSYYPPAVVDYKVQPILDERQIYSGCYGKARIHAYLYPKPGTNTGNIGCNIGLTAFQKTRDGEVLAGATACDPRTVFDEVPNGSNNGVSGGFEDGSDDATNYGSADPFGM